MKKFREIFFGFIFFTISISFCVILSIFAYSLIIDKSDLEKGLWILGLIIIIAIIFTICDIIRRKIMIDKPLNEILNATKAMSKGKFDIRLTLEHSYNEFDEFDLIKDALNNINQELSKREIFNNDFIANFSHEIKTPISVIRNYAKALSDKRITDVEKTKYKEALCNACDKLSDLINNILKLNKL